MLLCMNCPILDKQELKLTPGPLNDRNKVNTPASQEWFYKNIGEPLFKYLVDFFPSLAEILVTLRSNAQQWTSLKNNKTAYKFATISMPQGRVAKKILLETLQKLHSEKSLQSPAHASVIENIAGTGRK